MSFDAWADEIRRLDASLRALRPAASHVGVSDPDTAPWCELLRHKLLPQVESRPLLVVAVVGGTNIGKSVVFNHLCGENASGVSPLAAGTKHPVCLVPSDAADPAELAELFTGFELRPWTSPDDPLQASDAHRLFWRVGRHVPERLLLLDTPDVDSDAPVNWQRADVIRQSADVLIAVLTQQKYNDAAVKRFFRQAAEADKPVIAVFNQCDLAEDRAYWPEWLATFAGETGADVLFTYVVPYDRAAANAGHLPFYSVGRDGRGAVGQPGDLRAELAQLHFDTIKLRTFRGAMREILSDERGAPAYLRQVQRASGEFATAAHALSAADLARSPWPPLPSSLLVAEIRTWWDQQGGWSRSVHRTYRQVGRLLTAPIRLAWHQYRGEPRDPLETFRRQERDAVVRTIEHVFDQLERLAEVGNDVLAPRLKDLLRGERRAKLLTAATEAHDRLPPIDDEFRTSVRAELDRWQRENPRLAGVLRWIDQAAAIARPLLTVSLAVSGGIVAYEAAGHVVAHTVAEVAGDTAVATGVGEVAAQVGGEGAGHAAARLFGNLQRTHAQQRATWLATWLDEHLLHGLLVDLQSGADVARGESLAAVQRSLAALAKHLDLAV